MNLWRNAANGVQEWPLVHYSASSVDCSGPWLLWPRMDEALCRSVAQVGQLSPVLVDASGAGPVLVDGAARVACLRTLGQDVWCLDVGPCSEWDKGMLYVHANMVRLSLDADRVRALRFFVQRAPQGDVDEVLRTLGLAPRSKPARQALAWLKLPAHWDGYLTAGALPMVCADVLGAWDADDVAAAEVLFDTVSWSRGMIVQVLTWLHELRVRDGRIVADVLAAVGVADILRAGLSPKDAMARIAAGVRALRYPELTRLEREAASSARAITSGTSWRMVQPDQFESDAVELSVRVRSHADVLRAQVELTRMGQDVRWAAMWQGDAS